MACEGFTVAWPGFNVAVQGFNVALNGFTVALHGFNVALHGFTVALQGFTVALHGFIVALHGFNVALHGFNVALHGFNVALNGSNVACGGVAGRSDNCGEAAAGGPVAAGGRTAAAGRGRSRAAEISRRHAAIPQLSFAACAARGYFRGMRKNYILDANILIHDPQSVLHFADNTVIIPVGVLSEIDRFKKEMSDRGFNARAVVRLLDSLRGERSLADGVDLQTGGRLRVYCEPDRLLRGENGHADIEILRVAKRIQQAEAGTPVVIVTKDINLRIRADAAGLRAEDYESDRVPLAALRPASAELTLPSEAFVRFREAGRLVLPEAGLGPNAYVMLREADGGRATALARVDTDAGALISLRQPDKHLWGLKPRNREQYFAIDALLDERIQLVTLMGKAGTGKTVLAMAAALHHTLRLKRFKAALIARPVVPMGRDLGFLPGDIHRKMDPWMKPVVDTIEFLLDIGGAASGHREAETLMRSGIIEIQPLTYIRGRSISNRFVVIDEAQNLTPLEVKTVITRVGQDAKIVFTGDPYQIDNPYVDAGSNGFTYVVNRFQRQPIAAHVELRKGERSALAELAANLL